MASKIKEIIKFNSDDEVIEVIKFDRDPPDSQNKRRAFSTRVNPKIGDQSETSRIETFFDEIITE